MVRSVACLVFITLSSFALGGVEPVDSTGNPLPPIRTPQPPLPTPKETIAPKPTVAPTASPTPTVSPKPPASPTPTVSPKPTPTTTPKATPTPTPPPLARLEVKIDDTLDATRRKLVLGGDPMFEEPLRNSLLCNNANGLDCAGEYGMGLAVWVGPVDRSTGKNLLRDVAFPTAPYDDSGFRVTSIRWVCEYFVGAKSLGKQNCADENVSSFTVRTAFLPGIWSASTAEAPTKIVATLTFKISEGSACTVALTAAERTNIITLINQLGSARFVERESAQAALSALNVSNMEAYKALLEEATRASDAETVQRATRVLIAVAARCSRLERLPAPYLSGSESIPWKECTNQVESTGIVTGGSCADAAQAFRVKVAALKTKFKACASALPSVPTVSFFPDEATLAASEKNFCCQDCGPNYRIVPFRAGYYRRFESSVELHKLSCEAVCKFNDITPGNCRVIDLAAPIPDGWQVMRDYYYDRMDRCIGRPKGRA